MVGSLNWLVGILLPLHKFSNCLNFIGSFSWIKNNRAYLDLVELYNAGQKSIHYVKSFLLYPYIFCKPCITFA